MISFEKLAMVDSFLCSHLLIDQCLFFSPDQTKDLENLNQTLQNRCDQLQNELTSLRERYNQGHLRTKEILSLTFLLFRSRFFKCSRTEE